MSRAGAGRVGGEAARLIIAAALLAGALASNAGAQGTAGATPYVFAEHAQYGLGCFRACACPAVGLPLSGSFDLRLIRSDPLFTYYAVENLSARFPRDGGFVSVTGHGEYRIGGEFARTQQMLLDVVIGGDYEQSFDSGLVPVDYNITIDLAAHGFACYDTVIRVLANPAPTVGAPGLETVLAQAVPNPFRTGVELRFSRFAPPVEVVILDLQGRTVRSLGHWFWAADPVLPHLLYWDGLASDGTRARPGIYFVRALVDGLSWTQRIVKLE